MITNPIYLIKICNILSSHLFAVMFVPAPFSNSVQSISNTMNLSAVNIKMHYIELECNVHTNEYIYNLYIIDIRSCIYS